MEKCYCEGKNSAMWYNVYVHEKDLVTCFNDMHQVIETGLGNVGQRCVVMLLKVWIG